MESVGRLMRRLVLIAVTCPVTAFPVRQVIGVAFLTAAQKNRVFRLPMAIAPPPTNTLLPLPVAWIPLSLPLPLALWVPIPLPLPVPFPLPLPVSLPVEETGPW